MSGVSRCTRRSEHHAGGGRRRDRCTAGGIARVRRGRAAGIFSGGFKEESCHACHFDAEPNSGRVTIEGVPATFAPGERYTLTITLRRAGMKLAGFQLAARFKDSGAQAGTIAPGPGDAERVGVEPRPASSTRARRRWGLRSAQPARRSGRSCGPPRRAADR